MGFSAPNLDVDSRFSRIPPGFHSNISPIMDTWLFYAVVIGLIIVREFSSKMFFILLIVVSICALQGDDFSFSSWDVLPRAAHSFVAPLYDAINNN
jgi:hypothetical protein